MLFLGATVGRVNGGNTDDGREGKAAPRLGVILCEQDSQEKFWAGHVNITSLTN